MGYPEGWVEYQRGIEGNGRVGYPGVGVSRGRRWSVHMLLECFLVHSKFHLLVVLVMVTN